MLFKDVLILQPVEIRRKNLFQHFIFDCWYWQNYIDVFAYWSSRKAITKSTCDLTDELGEFRRAYDVWFEPFVSGEHVWQCFVKSWTCLSQKGHTFKLDRVSTCSSIFSHLPTCARYLSLSINSSHKPHFSLSFLKKRSRHCLIDQQRKYFDKINQIISNMWLRLSQLWLVYKKVNISNGHTDKITVLFSWPFCIRVAGEIFVLNGVYVGKKKKPESTRHFTFLSERLFLWNTLFKREQTLSHVRLFMTHFFLGQERKKHAHTHTHMDIAQLLSNSEWRVRIHSSLRYHWRSKKRV